MLTAVLIIAGSYLVGGVSVAYLAGRLLRGVDLREYGSGNLGPSNVWRHVSRPLVVPVGLAEIGQGCLGIAVAKLADQSLTVQVCAGLAALIGHNWSPFLRFTGGRGVGTAIGITLVLSWPALGAFIGVSLFGVALGLVPLFVLLGVVAAPFVALAATQAPEIVAGLAAMASLIVAKRLLTNQPAIPPGMSAAAVLLNRLLYDRDTREREVWVEGGQQR